MTPYDKGYEAAFKAVVDNNEYEVGSVEYDLWNEGYSNGIDDMISYIF